MKRLSITLHGEYVPLTLWLTEVEECDDSTSVFKVSDIAGVTAYFEAECNADVTELGELAVAALYSELVLDVTEV